VLNLKLSVMNVFRFSRSVAERGTSVNSGHSRFSRFSRFSCEISGFRSFWEYFLVKNQKTSFPTGHKKEGMKGGWAEGSP
jgi:hypothetical protein